MEKLRMENDVAGQEAKVEAAPVGESWKAVLTDTLQHNIYWSRGDWAWREGHGAREHDDWIGRLTVPFQCDGPSSSMKHLRNIGLMYVRR